MKDLTFNFYFKDPNQIPFISNPVDNQTEGFCTDENCTITDTAAFYRRNYFCISTRKFFSSKCLLSL
jgi:hypothetical protein